MQDNFDSYAEQLKKQPARFNELTQELLKEVSRLHHPHNRLLPADFIAILFSQYYPEALLGNNLTATKCLLSLNALRSIITANFTQVAENKIYSAVIMIYTQSLSKIVAEGKQGGYSEESKGLKLMARGVLMSEMMLKLIQRSHQFVPEYYRFVKTSMELALNLSGQMIQQVDEKQGRRISKCAEGSTLPKGLYLSAFKMEWSRSYLILFVKCLASQVHRFLSVAGPAKLTVDIQIHTQILGLIDQFKQKLSEIERTLLGSTNPAIEEKEKGEEIVYLEEPVAFRELTPRFYNEEKAMEITKLRRKKLKLTKKIQNDMRNSVLVKQQEAQVLDDVRRERGLRQQKKEMLIMQKQTVQAKKAHRQIKKVKLISKTDKDGKGSKLAKSKESKAAMGFKGFMMKAHGSKGRK